MRKYERMNTLALIAAPTPDWLTITVLLVAVPVFGALFLHCFTQFK